MIDEQYFKTRLSYNKNRDILWEIIAKHIQGYTIKDGIILDIGAGYCNFINHIQAKEKHALDTFNIKKYAEDNVATHIRSCTNLDNFKSNYFDLIFSSNLFEHLEMKDFRKTLTEIKRVLKNDGRLIILQPNFRYCYKEYFDDYTHKTVFSDISMVDFLEANDFKIVKSIPRFLPYSLKSKLPKNRLLLKIYIHLPFKPLAKQMLIVARKQ